MNASSTSLRSLFIAFTGLGLAIVSHGQTIFSDTFENNTATTNLNGQTMSDGVTTYSVVANSAVFQSHLPKDTDLGLGSYVGELYLNSGNRSLWVTTSSNTDSISSYTFNIGYLFYAGSGTFGINARGDSSSTDGTFSMSWSGSTATFSYINNSGVSTVLGTVTANPSQQASSYYLTNVSVTVTGNLQQLSVAGTAIGSAVATQGTYNDSTTDNVSFYALTTGSTAEVDMDNISATVGAIPEPKTVALAFGTCALLAVGCWRLKKK